MVLLMTIHGMGVHLQQGVDDGLQGAGVEEVLLAVVVWVGGGDDDELGVAVACLLIEGGLQRQRLVGQIILDIVVLDGRHLVVDKVDTRGDNVDSGDVIMLCQKRVAILRPT